MKQIGLSMAVLACALGLVQGQVTVEITQSQDQFLPGEAMPVAVRIKNLSGQTLQFGESEDWLTFSIEPLEGSVVGQTGNVPVAGEFSLPTSKIATKRADLAPYFNMTRPGRYQVRAHVKVKQWDREIESPPLRFSIIQGTKLWEAEFGVPGGAGVANSPPESRKYILQQASYLKGQIRLYLRVTDSTGSKTYNVVNIGVMHSFSAPEHELDSANNLHVLYSTGPKPDGLPAYLYTKFNPNGETLVRQIYEYAGVRPRLQTDDAGNVTVLGRAATVTSNNVPARAPGLSPGELQRP